jgi:signal transduction histidine kinase
MTSWKASAADRIAFVYSGAFALGVAILGVAVFWAMHVAFTRQLDAVIADEAATLAAEARGDDGMGELADTIAQREAGASRTGLLYAVFDREGRRIHGTLRTPPPPAPGIQDIGFTGARGEEDSGRGLAIDLAGGNRLLVAANDERLSQIDRIIISVFAAGFAAILLLGIAGALLLGAYLRRRLNAIGEGAEAIIAGDIGRRMPVSPRGDEFDRLASSLNAMLERIGGLIENVRQVSSDVAHDLRTPLTRLRNQLEQGEAAVDAGANAKVIEEAIRRVDEVLALFAAILRIAEVESGQIRRSFGPVDLSALAVELAESYAPALADGGRALAWSVEPDLRIEGDRELIAQAIVNLLENAQGHTPKGTAIEMTLAASGDAVRLSVADSGPGVAAADRDRIVRRFIRLDGSRATAGHGLGLNLVAAIARLHHAQLRFADNRPGLIVAIEFPGGAPRQG